MGRRIGLVHRSSATIRRSESNYRAIFDAVIDAILVHDLEAGVILSSSRRASEMRGYSKEMMGLGLEGLWTDAPPFTSKGAIGQIRKAQQRHPQLIEWKANDKAGCQFRVKTNLRLVNLNGEERILAAVRNISALKAA